MEKHFRWESYYGLGGGDTGWDPDEILRSHPRQLVLCSTIRPLGLVSRGGVECLLQAVAETWEPWWAGARVRIEFFIRLSSRILRAELCISVLRAGSGVDAL